MPKLSLLERPENEVVMGLNLNELNLDESYINVNNVDDFITYEVHRECYKCPFTRVFLDDVFVTNSNLKYRIVDVYNETNVICDIDKDFGEFGVYNLTIENGNCSITTVQEPVSIYFPIITVILIYGVLCGLIYCIIHFGKFGKKEEEKDSKKPRIKSLDTFRGITIAMMIFANYGCAGYASCEHAVWNGLHVADVIFPWFMWIMGVCIPISVTSQIKKKVPFKTVLLNTLKRAIKLFMVGLFLNFSTGLDNMRIFGVLQRFAVGYFFVTLICMICFNENSTKMKYTYVEDLVKLMYAWIVILCILLVYLLVIFLASADDCPKGYFGPGGRHEFGKYLNCTGGVTGLVDRAILDKHLYAYATIRTVFSNKLLFDPEGILGCLPTIVHAFIGVQAGIISMTYKTHKDRLIRWVAWALVLGITGGALCGFSKEEGVIPINKNLWSLSFVCVTCSLAFILLSICYVLIDMVKIWNGKPFIFSGMNSILMYIGHELCSNNFPVRWRVHGDLPHATHFISLVENVWGAGFWVFVSYYLYRIDYYFTL